MKFNLTSDNAKTLGIVFSNDYDSMVKLNVTPKLNAFKNCLKQWQHRKLSLLGKSTVIKTFAIPKLTLLLSVLPNFPDDISKAIKCEIFFFIWDNKPYKIKRSTLIKPFENGGINLTDFDSF